jgi:uncharacterized protein
MLDPNGCSEQMRFPVADALVTLSVRYPRQTLAFTLFSALLAAWFALSTLTFTVDRTQMLDPEHPVQKTWRAYRDEFDNLSDFVVLARGEPELARQTVEALAARLQAEPETFSNVLFRFDLPQLSRSALYYVSPADLAMLSEQLDAARPWLAALASRGGIGAALDDLARPGTPEQTANRLTPALPLLLRTLEGLVVTLESRGQQSAAPLLPDIKPDLPGLNELGIQPGQTTVYTSLEGGHAYLLLLTARDRSGAYTTDLHTLQRLRAIIHEVGERFHGVELTVSGEPVINADETQDALRDAVQTAVLAITLVGLLLMIVFGEMRKPLAVMLSLLVGISWTSALAAWTLGQLNMLTVNFVTILVALGMSFGIHVLCRYKEERSLRGDAAEAVAATLRANGGNFLGAVATAVAFFALHFTSFLSAGQLGIVTGSGVILCFFAMVTTLPSALMLLDRGRPEPDPAWHQLRKADDWLQRRRGTVLLCSIVITLLSLPWLVHTPFDYNLMNIQAPGAPALRLERYLQRFQYSALYAVSMVDSVAEAQALSSRYAEQPTVGRVQTLSTFVPVQVHAKFPLVKKITDQARSLQPPSPARPRTAAELLALFGRYQAARGQLLAAIPVWEARGVAVAPLRDLLKRLDVALDTGNPGPVQSAMQQFEAEQNARLRTQMELLKQQSPEPPEVVKNLPAALLARVLSPEGRIAVRMFPREDVWDRVELGRFVRNLQHIDPQVTGYPVLIYFYLEDMREAYAQSGRNALIVISVLLLLHFRSVPLTLLALFPKLLGILWMLGAMGLLGRGFNPINFLAAPLTLGIGLIFGVHVLESRHRSLFADSTGPAIVLSGLATIIGFATLMLATHRGLASFGLVMVLGVAANLLTSLVTLPAIRSRATRQPEPDPARAALP